MHALGLMFSGMGAGAATEAMAKKTVVRTAEVFIFVARGCSWNEWGAEVKRLGVDECLVEGQTPLNTSVLRSKACALHSKGSSQRLSKLQPIGHYVVRMLSEP